jgi:CRISPR-associated endoribonuclease Cas6
MRLRIEFALKGLSIPLNHKSMIQGIIYHMLARSEKTATLHDSGYPHKNRPFKLFVFSDLIGSAVVDRTTWRMDFVTNAYVEVASWDEHVMIAIARELQRSGHAMFGPTPVGIIAVDIMPEPRLDGKEPLRLVSVSPVTVYRTSETHTTYLSPDDPDFARMIHQNIINKHLAVGEFPPDDLPDMTFPVFRKRSVRYRNVFSEAYDITMILGPASPMYMKLVLDTGIGSKNPMGFGMMRREN